MVRFRPLGHSLRRPLRTVVAGVVASALVLEPAAGAVARVDLRTDTGAKIKGAYEVAAAGDVNGDGIPDILVSRGDIIVKPTRGRTWVVFGARPTPSLVRLGRLKGRGFVIEGAEDRDFSSRAAGAGDVNGDGLDDIVVGGPGVDNNGGDSGTAYVVFGKADNDPVELAEFDAGIQGDAGFRIDGPSSFSLAGEDVSGAGDVNSDGLADVIVSAPFRGSFYVVWGKGDAAPIDLMALEVPANPFGFRIDAPPAESSRLWAVGAAGDVNGDGRPDVVVGATETDESDGVAYVVFGKPDGVPVNVTELGASGFMIEGWLPYSNLGYAVAGAGDVNADGLADVIVGAPSISPTGVGHAYVVFGKTDTEPVHPPSLERLGTGFHIRGALPKKDTIGMGLGISVAAAGDVNGDGRSDVIIGAHLADMSGRIRSGSAYVIFGKAGSGEVRVARLRPRRGFRIDGAWSYNGAGGSVAGPGDIDGDGIPDLLVGASGVGGDPKFGLDDPGAVYLVAGRR